MAAIGREQPVGFSATSVYESLSVGGGKRTLRRTVAVVHNPAVNKMAAIGIALLLPLSGCFNNESIDHEIAGKCGISESDYKRAEASLDEGLDGMSLDAGRCRLNRTTKGVIEVTILEDR